MKNLIILFTVIASLSCNGVAQYRQRRDPGAKFDKQTISEPILVDKDQLRDDISDLKELKDIYKELKSENFGAVYNCTFDIDTNGRVLLVRVDEKTFLTKLNTYVETRFVNYKWKPAYKLCCKNEKVQVFSSLSFVFNTEKGYINCMIEAIQEAPRRIVFEYNIKMN